MSIDISKIKDTYPSISKFINDKKFNLSFSNNLDSDSDTSDSELNSELMSNLYCN